MVSKRPEETLRALDQIGYREAEVIGTTLDRIWNDLERTQLKPVSVHLDSALLRPENHDRLRASLMDLRARGFEYVVYPYVPPEERHGEQTFRQLADALNRAGALCRAADIALCYHNHAFEFQPFGSKTGFEILMDAVDKAAVGLEMDVFWVAVGGHDPVELLRKYTGRVKLLHIKDKAAEARTQFSEDMPRSWFQEVGAGVLDWKRILAAARGAGVQHYFVEQDATPGNPLDSLRTSFEYLQRLKF